MPRHAFDNQATPTSCPTLQIFTCMVQCQEYWSWDGTFFRDGNLHIHFDEVDMSSLSSELEVSMSRQKHLPTRFSSPSLAHNNLIRPHTEPIYDKTTGLLYVWFWSRLWTPWGTIMPFCGTTPLASIGRIHITMAPLPVAEMICSQKSDQRLAAAGSSGRSWGSLGTCCCRSTRCHVLGPWIALGVANISWYSRHPNRFRLPNEAIGVHARSYFDASAGSPVKILQEKKFTVLESSNLASFFPFGFCAPGISPLSFLIKLLSFLTTSFSTPTPIEVCGLWMVLKSLCWQCVQMSGTESDWSWREYRIGYTSVSGIVRFHYWPKMVFTSMTFRAGFSMFLSHQAGGQKLWHDALVDIATLSMRSTRWFLQLLGMAWHRMLGLCFPSALSHQIQNRFLYLLGSRLTGPPTCRTCEEILQFQTAPVRHQWDSVQVQGLLTATPSRDQRLICTNGHVMLLLNVKSRASTNIAPQLHWDQYCSIIVQSR